MHIILGTFQSASNSGHWKIYHFGCICGTLLVFLKGIFGAVAKQVAPKDEVDVFVCKIAKCHTNGLLVESSRKSIGNYFPGSTELQQPKPSVPATCPNSPSPLGLIMVFSLD